ncbi:MAG: hypothetical protein V7603_1385 [Micromonosporaceae bacterium]
MAGSGSSFEAQQLVELLSVVSSSQDEETATQAAIERAAQALEAETSALVVAGRAVRSVGFPAGSNDHDLLATVGLGRHVRLDISGIGSCAAAAAALGDRDESRLVIARRGADFSVEEHNLIRGMARVLGLTLQMLRTLDAERRRQRHMEQLYRIQRAISRRVPLSDVLGMIVDGVRDVLGAEDDFVGLWLIDPMEPGLLTLAASVGSSAAQERWPRRLPIADAGAMGRVVQTDEVVHHGAQAPGAALARLMPNDTGCLAVPVHENGQVAGGLLISRREDQPSPKADQEKMLSFAEHVSLALTDARTLSDMNEAMHDSLTGLASRALFLDRLSNELAHMDRGDTALALLFIDLDRFKQVNDTFGHNAGDVLLVGVAERIQAAIRACDVAARFGGDEFAVMLRGAVSVENTRDVSARIIASLHQPFPVPGGTADIDASIGIALVEGERVEAEQLLHRADVAMYQAKRTGRGRSVLFCADPISELRMTGA